ncbi:hypothetical protein QR680_014707 [Steinernema hermaphroditum]|uniref:Uncharacterized protein n=1 Tax=Steinernema hermaphroditum TaxID=289476 RepID=A0AA39IC55_9BILA|nr:hypothetical protein QR680_014707 [Steinernema hermaphroditum]
MNSCFPQPLDACRPSLTTISHTSSRASKVQLLRKLSNVVLNNVVDSSERHIKINNAKEGEEHSKSYETADNTWEPTENLKMATISLGCEKRKEREKSEFQESEDFCNDGFVGVTRSVVFGAAIGACTFGPLVSPHVQFVDGPSGATLHYTCTTDFGEVTAAVICPSAIVTISCGPNGNTKSTRIFLGNPSTSVNPEGIGSG